MSLREVRVRNLFMDGRFIAKNAAEGNQGIAEDGSGVS